MIFVGLGFRKAVTANSFENLFRQVLNLTELPGPIKALATLDTKALNPDLLSSNNISDRIDGYVPPEIAS